MHWQTYNGRTAHLVNMVFHRGWPKAVCGVGSDLRPDWRDPEPDLPRCKKCTKYTD